MKKLLIALVLTAGFTGPTGIAHAQTAVEGRVDRLEREMRAVQRKVFPGGNGQTVEPDITAPDLTLQVPGTPFTGPVANLEQRINGLEAQLATLTGQIEQLQYKQRTMEEAYTANKRTTDARLKAIEDGLSSTGSPGDIAVVAPPVVKPTATPAKPATTTPAAKPATGARAELIAAVEKPDTGDAAEDLYVYGFRLWTAKLYPESRAPLGQVVSKYPQNRRASFAQNLVGRAWLDEGKSQEAAKAFYDNYVKMPSGERAADSLYYLSKSLQKLKAAPAEVCKVYSAIDTEYPGRMSLEQQADIDVGKAASKCK